MVALLAASAGCLGYVTGGGEITNETLDADPPAAYEWDTDADVRIEFQADSTYLTVSNVSDREELRLYEETGYGIEEPLEFRAFRYRYANGTVINGSQFREQGGEIEQTPDEVWVRFGEDMTDGKIAYTSDGSPRRFLARTYVKGSYEVVLPPGYTTDFWLFGHGSPRGYDVETVDGRERLVWEEVTTELIVVQAYRERDLPIFVGIFIIATAIGIAGYLYFRRQLEELRETRQEMGLDVEEEETDDFGDDGPPPGMR